MTLQHIQPPSGQKQERNEEERNILSWQRQAGRRRGMEWKGKVRHGGEGREAVYDSFLKHFSLSFVFYIHTDS